MAKKEEEKEMTDKEINKFERHCWVNLKNTIQRSIDKCPHKKCEECKYLKMDLDTIDGMVMAVTEDPEPVKGTTA